MTFKSINPYDTQPIAEYEPHSEREIDRRIQAARSAFGQWRSSCVTERSDCLNRLARALQNQKQDLASLMTREMGKRLSEAVAEIEKCAWVCEYYAGEGPNFLHPEAIATDAGRSYVSFQPLGVVLAVMPWNFPFWQVFRFAAPAVMSGNAGLLKPAGNVTGCGLAIETLFREAGFPEGLFATLLVPGKDVPPLIARPEISAVTLTGSAPAGRAVAAAAGEHLKKSVLELGGSDAYIVLEDAPVEATVELCAQSRFLNAGQSCIAAKRFIVLESVIERFQECFVEKARQRLPGNPLADQTTLAPLARADLRDELHEQVERSLSRGAIALTGAEIPGGPGAFYPATVLAGVRPGMPAFDEELFGPAAAIVTAASEAEAVRLANQSRFGLGAAVFTADPERGERIARDELEAGCCFVNDFVKSDPRLPFGGVKESGFGRELSRFGMHEFVNIKTLSVNSID